MTEPDRRCAQHLEGDPGYPCSHCEDAASAWRDWRHERDAIEARQRQLEAQARMSNRQREIATCGLCDDAGQTPTGYLCVHNPQQVETNRRGAAECRAALEGAAHDAR